MPFEAISIPGYVFGPIFENSMAKVKSSLLSDQMVYSCVQFHISGRVYIACNSKHAERIPSYFLGTGVFAFLLGIPHILGSTPPPPFFSLLLPQQEKN